MMRFKQVQDAGGDSIAPPSKPLPNLGENSSPLRRLQENIDKLNLIRDSTSPDELWKRYSQTFTQYFNTIGGVHKNVFEPIESSSAVPSTSGNLLDMLLFNWIASLPKTYKESAKNIVSGIKSSLKMQTEWDISENGKLLRDGNIIDGHLIDMLSFAVTKRKMETPQGFHDFLEMLQDLNIPKTLVNRKRFVELPSSPVDENDYLQSIREKENISPEKRKTLQARFDKLRKNKKRLLESSDKLNWLVNDYKYRMDKMNKRAAPKVNSNYQTVSSKSYGESSQNK